MPSRQSARTPVDPRFCSTSTGRSPDRAPRPGRARAGVDARAADRHFPPLRARRLHQRPPRVRGAADRLDRLDHLPGLARLGDPALGRRGPAAGPRARALQAPNAAVPPTTATRRSCSTCACASRTRCAIAAYHWRGAPNEEAARAALLDVAERAEAAGLHTHWGRKVLEVRPPVRIDKGVAITNLLRDAAARRGALRRR